MCAKNLTKHAIWSALLFAAATSAGPREDVNEIADVIEAKFFDPTRAKSIAGDLREDAAAGSFDRFVERSDLAKTLTQQLRKIDGHFSVSWATQPAARGPQPIDGLFGDARTNYGFRSVERLPGNIGYISLAYAADIEFSDKTSPAKRAADAALAQVRGTDAVILDLRHNGGGGPSMVGYLVSAFVDPQADVYNTFHARAGMTNERPEIAYASPMLDVPVYVVVNRRTASAAESIAFTLQAAKRARVIGERTAGAANPGEPFSTPQGFSVFVATGSPRNPITGNNWEGEGVRLDIETSSDRALYKARHVALEALLAGSISGAARVDAQRALDALTATPVR